MKITYHRRKISEVFQDITYKSNRFAKLKPCIVAKLQGAAGCKSGAVFPERCNDSSTKFHCCTKIVICVLYL